MSDELQDRSDNDIAQGTALDAGHGSPSGMPENPFVGPQALRRENQLWGRDRERAELLDLLVAERIVVLYSPSGAGKTSLVQAGLLNDLSRTASQSPPDESGRESLADAETLFQIFPIIRIGLVGGTLREEENTASGAIAEDGTAGRANPYLARVLAAVRRQDVERAGLNEGKRDTATPDNVDNGETSVPTDAPSAPQPQDEVDLDLDRFLTAQEITNDQGWIRPQLLIFDQFEEIVAQNRADRQGKETFFAELGRVLSKPHRWALFVLREDYLAALDPYRLALPTRLTNRYRLERLDPESAAIAIGSTAGEAGVTVEPDAADALVDRLMTRRVTMPDGESLTQVAPDVDPMHLQVVCRSLWQETAANRVITVADVDRHGDVDHALRAFYAETVAAAATGDSEAGAGSERRLRRWLATNLITPDGRRRNLLPYQPGHDTAGLDDEAVQHLLETRLLRVEGRIGDLWLELAHDQLVEPIRDDNEAWEEHHLEPFQRQAQVWDEQNRDSDFLLQGDALDAAEEWAAGNPATLLELDRDFLQACRHLADQVAQEKRRTQLIQWLAIGATALAIVAVLFGLVALRQRNRAVNAQLEARSHELSALADVNLTRDPQLSLLLASRALEEWPTTAANKSIQNALSVSRLVHMFEVDAPVNDLVVSEDGQRMALGGKNGVSIYAWSNERWEPLSTAQLDSDTMTVAFDSTGSELAAVESNGEIRLIDAASGALTATYLPTNDAAHARFSPDDRRLVAATLGGKVWVLDRETGEQVEGELADDDLYALDFHPTESLIATGGSDERVTVWDYATRSTQYVCKVSAEVSSVDFSPDGLLLAAVGDWDSRYTAVRVWRVGDETCKPVYESSDHTDYVYDAIFAPDSGQLLTGSYDNTARLIDPATGASTVFRGHTDDVHAVQFTADGQYVLTAGGDMTVRTWAVTPTYPLTLLKVDGPLVDVAVTPDGGYLVVISNDGEVFVLDVAGRELLYHEESPARMLRLKAHPARNEVLAPGLDGTLRRWAIPSGDSEDIFVDPAGMELFAAAYDQTGATIAVSNREGDIFLVEPEAGKLMQLVDRAGSAFYALAFRPDSEHLAAVGPDGVYIWHYPSGALLFEDSLQHAGDIWDVEFSADGDTMVTVGGDTSAILWRRIGLDSRKATQIDFEPATVLEAHSGRIIRAHIGGERGYLATASLDGTVRLWDTVNGEEILVVDNPDDVRNKGFIDAEFIPGRPDFITIGQDGRLRRYTYDADVLRTLAREHLLRDWTELECKNYFGTTCDK